MEHSSGLSSDLEQRAEDPAAAHSVMVLTGLALILGKIRQVLAFCTGTTSD